ncbi:hypothetical protein ACHAAC_15680, partial [Aeromicrobium sp. CF4.19]|uniref:TPR repeat region-containing protein n=1 Tax=Aeromicrobium sp. CF4.19 TaxID=3373082 RepID=UPI003EE437A1
IDLSPQEKFEAYQAAVENGTLPSVEEMTETERQAFLQENPGLLEEWMQVEEPPEELQEVIVGLALPVVDGDDADVDAQRIIDELGKDGLDGPNPNTILDALDDVAGINEGLALLTPWAAREGVNLNHRDPEGALTNPSLRNAQDYLSRFYEQTYPHKDELVKHINADGHVWTTTGPPSGQETVNESGGYSEDERQNLLSGYADGLLNLSNHDVGGGWNQLPEAVRADAQEVFSTEQQRHGSGFYYTPVDNEGFASLAELLGNSTVEPGDGLAKEMASTYAASLQAHDDWQGQLITSGSSDLDFSAVGANVLDMVGRNEDASLELITGDTDGLPSQYPENFNALIFDQPWENTSGDNSEEARVASFYENIADSHETNTAASTAAFNALSEDLTDVTDGNFRHLMGEDGDSAARRNTLLTQTLTDALANHLDTFAAEQGSSGAEGSPLSEADRIRLMTFIASDYVPKGSESDTDELQRGAARLTSYIAAYQQDNIDSWAENPNGAGPRELGSANGRIQGMLDVALINEAQERDVNQDGLEAERIRNIKIGYGVVSGLLSPIPNSGLVTGPGGALLNNLLTEDHIPAPNAGVSTDWQADGSHITDANTRSMLGALVASGRIDVDDLPSVLDDPGASNAQVADAADDLLTSYFEDHPPHDPTFYTDFSNEIGSVYRGFDDTYSLLGMNEEEMEDFLVSDSWGRPR